MRSFRTHISGISLWQFLLAAVLLAMGAALIISYISVHDEQARIMKAQKDIVLLQTALNLYKKDNGFYPSNAQGLEALVIRPVTNPKPIHWHNGGYIEPRLPLDPWGKPYQYLNPGLRNPNSVDVYTLAPDRKMVIVN